MDLGEQQALEPGKPSRLAEFAANQNLQNLCQYVHVRSVRIFLILHARVGWGVNPFPLVHPSSNFVATTEIAQASGQPPDAS